MKTLRGRFFLFVSLTIITVSIALGWALFRQYERQVFEEFRERAVYIVTKFAKASQFGISTRNLFKSLDPLVTDLSKELDVSYLVVLDRSGEVLAHSDTQEVGKVYSDELSNKALVAVEPVVTLLPEKYEVGLMVQAEESLIKGTEELEEPFAELEENSTEKKEQKSVNRLGAVRIGLSLKRINQRVDQALRRLLQATVLLILGFILVGITVAYFFARSVVKPLNQLVQVTRQMSAGNLDVQAETQTYQEVGNLASGFNQMAKKLKQSFNEIKTMNRELDAFTYSVSHDLRGPLVALEGFSKILLSDLGKLPVEKIEHYLKRINFNATKMANLIDALLELSRVGRVVGEKKEVALAGLMEEIKEEFGKRLSDKEMVLKWRQAKKKDGQLPKVSGDPNQIYRIFANLVNNAIKYSTPGAIINVGNLKICGDGKFNKLYVSNTNSYIPEKYWKKIFQIFERVEGTEAEGTGIGLSLVKKIIESHGGKIRVRSNRARGTIFCFSLPLTKS